jgi:hypothetical protein
MRLLPPVHQYDALITLDTPQRRDGRQTPMIMDGGQ